MTAEELRRILRYEPETGNFYWLIKRQGVRLNKPAGGVGVGSYIQIRIDGTLYYAHRLAWLYIHGVWPANKIDHRDENGFNNRLDNLREATNAQNAMNTTKAYSHNKSSGIKGVSFSRTRMKWEAHIQVNRKHKFLGYYDNMEEALVARKAAELDYFGEFAT
jgi:hypothetical protein